MNRGRLRAILAAAILCAATPSLAAEGQGPQGGRANAGPLPGAGTLAAGVGVAGRLLPVPELIGPKIRVKEFDPAIRYYEAVFDLVLAARINNREIALSFRNAQPSPRQPAGTIPEPFLILQLDPTVEPAASNIPVFVVRVPDVAAVRQRAVAAGFPMSGSGPGGVGIGRDPSGNVVEVIEANSYLTIPKAP